MLSIKDINKREKSVCSRFENTFQKCKRSAYNEAGVLTENNVASTIGNWTRLNEDTNRAFEKALDVFIEYASDPNATASKITYYGNILNENVDKVRDAKQLMNSINYRNSHLKSKILTKINNKHDDVTNAIFGSLNNLQNSLKGALPKTDVTKDGIVKSDDNQQNEAALESVMSTLLEHARNAAQCDRILSNYGKLSKVFNLDSMVYGVLEQDIKPAIYQIARCIDTLDTSFDVKYNTALETAYYVFNKHFIKIPSETIVECVTDYFIFSGDYDESIKESIDKVAKKSVLFEYGMWDNIFLSADTISKDDLDLTADDASLLAVSEGDKHFLKDIKSKFKKKDNRTPEEKRDDKVKQMVAEFRENCLKNKDDTTVDKLKQFINKFFAQSPYQIVYELPNMLSIIRGVFVVGGFAIHPVVGIVTLIADQTVKLHLTRKQCDKMIEAYKNEIAAVNDKLKNAKDEDTKDRYNKYLDALKKDLEKIKDYSYSNFTDEENDERMDYDYDDDFDLDDDDWGDDDWDTDFDEQTRANLASIVLIEQLMSSITDQTVEDNLDGIIKNNIFKMSNDDIDALGDFVITVPVIMEKNAFKEALISERYNLRAIREKSYKDYMRIETLNSNIAKMESTNVYNTASSMKSIICYLKFINEAAKIKNDGYINEMEFTNSLKLAMKNLKRDAMNLSDKEKRLSSNIDASVNSISKSIETSLQNGNREAVIKGSIIPSASKCIKLALTVGVAWAINPAIAVIGAIGTFACMKKMQNKERQLVLDDIEIELKMCERYIQRAENNNDLKKVREYEKIQRNLERQQQRIKYKMNVEHNQNVPDSTATPKSLRDGD